MLEVLCVLGDFLLSKKMDQRICIKFCVKNEIKCSKTLEMLTVANGETVLSKQKCLQVVQTLPRWPGRCQWRASLWTPKLTVFFDYRGVVHQEFLPYGRTVNKEYYLVVMRRLREAIRRKRPELWKNNSWLLHHDNAPAHSSLQDGDLQRLRR